MKNIISQLEISSMKLILRKIPIFGGFDDDQLYKIFSVLEEVRYTEGDFIFKRGEAPTHIYLILKGKVQFVKKTKKNYHMIFEFGEGDCIGEASVIGLYPHTLSAIAAEDVELVIISKNSLLNFYEIDKELFSHLMLNICREISRKLSMTNDLLLHYIDKSNNFE